MKKLSIILACILVAITACTKSKDVHPELGDGNEEFLTVGSTTAHVEYTRANMAELRKVVFHYSLSGVQQFAAAEMTKRESFFELALNSLVCDTLYDYYYELFYNSGETSITERKTFHTQAYDTPEPPTPPSGAPEGATNGLFTINENGDQVYFSQGNLQYDISNQTWSFMDHQYDVVETDGQDVGANYSNQNIVSLFSWGTSGWDSGNVYYHPWDAGDESNDSWYGTPGGYDLTGEYANSDWGVYNSISNGGNSTGLWRTLTIEEWNYIFNNRITSSGIRFAKAVVNDVSGVIILPDDWNDSMFMLNNPNASDAAFSTNIITIGIWGEMEANGAVFLPAAGVRYLTTVYIAYMGGSFCGYHGFYWSASCQYSGDSKFLGFDDNVLETNAWDARSLGRSVRLVQDANK